MTTQREIPSVEELERRLRELSQGQVATATPEPQESTLPSVEELQRRFTEQDAGGKTPQQLADAVIARQGAAPGVDLEPTGKPSLLARVSDVVPDSIGNIPGLRDPRILKSILSGLGVFERQVVEPVTAVATVAQVPSVLGAAGVPGLP